MTVEGVAELRCRRPAPPLPSTRRVEQLARHFGLSGDGEERETGDPVRVTLGPGRIVAFVGPSGSGKTTALVQLESRHPRAHNVGRVQFNPNLPLVESILPAQPLAAALSLLTACGLGEPRLWVRRYHELSQGERFRARLARALGSALADKAPAPLLCDEFCTGLHQRVSRAIAHNFRKLVWQHRLCAVVALSDETLAGDLQPDTLVRLGTVGPPAVRDYRPVRRRFGLLRRLRIEPGRKSDYAAFAAMHYRDRDELGFVDKVFVLREGLGGEALGIVVYSHGPLELALRNRATEGWFSGRPDRVNKHLRILRRLVIHPDVRGCGLGHWLVRQTLPRVGTRFVECLASMGAVNPVFEKAGMQRIGQCELPRTQRRLLDELETLGVDPTGPDLPTAVCRRPGVRHLVARFVYNWYRATTGCGRHRTRQLSPRALAETFRGLIGSRPVYYLWSRPRQPGATIDRQATVETESCCEGVKNGVDDPDLLPPAGFAPAAFSKGSCSPGHGPGRLRGRLRPGGEPRTHAGDPGARRLADPGHRHRGRRRKIRPLLPTGPRPSERMTLLLS